MLEIDCHPADPRLRERADAAGLDELVHAALEEPLREVGAGAVLGDCDVEDSKLETVLDFTGGGAKHVFDYVDHKAVVQGSLAMASRGGHLYRIGARPEGSATLPVVGPENFSKAILGVNMGTSTIKRDIPMHSRLHLDGEFKLDELATAEIALGEIEQGYEKLKDSSMIRVVITDFEN